MGAQLKPRPILVPNPRSDRSFVTYIDHLSREELSTATALEARLREQFPRAVVRARGLSGEDVTMWYVYRDGHWTSEGTESEEESDVRAGGRSPGDH
jgi:hypothetical protein